MPPPGFTSAWLGGPPPPVTVEERIKILREALNPESTVYLPHHIANIEKLIALYQNGQVKLGDEVWVMDGQIVSKEATVNSGKHVLHEDPKFFRCNHLAQGETYSLGAGSTMHEVYARIQLLISEGGDGTIYRITFFNDSGSDALSLTSIDLTMLGNLTNWVPATSLVQMPYANCTAASVQFFNINMQLCRASGAPWSDWFLEIAVLTFPVGPVPRLSGMGWRRHHFIGTNPTYTNLAISRTNGGMVGQRAA